MKGVESLNDSARNRAKEMETAVARLILQKLPDEGYDCLPLLAPETMIMLPSGHTTAQWDASFLEQRETNELPVFFFVEV